MTERLNTSTEDLKTLGSQDLKTLRLNEKTPARLVTNLGRGALRLGREMERAAIRASVAPRPLSMTSKVRWVGEQGA